MNIASLSSIASYVLLALGLYTMAKRRGIRNPWLAWIPVANLWLLGCISDQYLYLTQGQNKAKRKLMLILAIVSAVLVIAVVIMAVSWFVALIGDVDRVGLDEAKLLEMSQMDEEQLMKAFAELADDIIDGNATFVEDTLGTLMGIACLSLILCVVAVWLAVLEYIAYYHVFLSADPKNAGMFLALSIVLSMFGLGIVMALLVFLCREKDGGMPPRGDEMTPPPPGWIPPQPTVDPWDQSADR